jgi:signal transduction histidine kinase
VAARSTFVTTWQLVLSIVIKFGCILFFVCLCNASQSFAQVPLFERFQLLHFTDQNGLPQNSVKRLTVDASGYLWMATENGLTRFDGRTFHVYDKAQLGLSSNLIFALRPSVVQADGPKGHNSCFYVEDGDGHFARVQEGKAYPDSNYQDIHQKALPFYKRSKSGIIEAFSMPRYDTGVMFDQYYIPARNDRKVYLCTPNSITFFQHGKQRWKKSFPAGNIWNFFMLDNRLCFLSEGNSVKTISESGTVTLLPINGDLAGQLSSGTKITEFNLFWNYASDQLFIGLRDKVYQLSFDDRGAIQTRLLLSGFDMRFHYVQAVHYEPGEGILWMGSFTQGLYMFKKKSFLPVSWGRTDVEDVFYAQTVSPGGTLTTANGMQVKKKPATTAPRVGTAPAVKSAYEWDARSILTDRQGNIWLKHHPWLYQLDSLGRRQINKIGLPNDYSKVIYQGPDGLIWLGTEQMGLYYVDPSEKQPVPRAFMPKGFNDITYITSAGMHQLWVGTRSGLYRVDKRSPSKVLIPGTGKWAIKSIFTDQEANVWLTVADVGIVLFRAQKLTVFPLDRNKYLASAHCVVADDNGNFWVPTNRGLFQIRKKDLLAYRQTSSESASLLPDYYQYFDQSSGFLINEFNGNCQPCSVRLPDGTISLPSLKGLIWFKPETVITPPQHPVITVDGWELAGKRSSHNSDTITLPKDPGLFKVHFSTPFFGSTENLHVAYRLEKDAASTDPDGRWYTLDNNFPIIQLSNLNSGNYTLTIRKTNGFYKDSLTAKSILIVVPPYWYETWWAKALAILVLLAAAYVLSQWRVHSIGKEKIRLEQAVVRRTKELNQANQELEASKNEVSRQLVIMSRLLTSMSHDIRSPLHYIELFSDRIPALLDSGQPELILEISQSIHKSSRDMSALLKDLLDYLRVNLYGQSLQLQEVNLSSLVVNKQNVFKDAVSEKGNSLAIDVPETLQVITDYQLLSIIIHNLLDNACKYTRNGTISITGRQATEGLTLTIANTGTALSADLIESFNRVEHQGDESSSQISKGSGLGLVIVKEVAHLLGISVIAAQTEINTFTIIFSRAPLKTSERV